MRSRQSRRSDQDSQGSWIKTVKAARGRQSILSDQDRQIKTVQSVSLRQSRQAQARPITERGPYTTQMKTVPSRRQSDQHSQGRRRHAPCQSADHTPLRSSSGSRWWLIAFQKALRVIEKNDRLRVSWLGGDHTRREDVEVSPTQSRISPSVPRTSRGNETGQTWQYFSFSASGISRTFLSCSLEVERFRVQG